MSLLPQGRFGPLTVLNTAALMKPHVHGRHPKGLVVLHETVSANIPGLSDIEEVEKYLADKDYGIHGMTDADGNIAWAVGLGDAVFWQAGGVNERSIGIEQVSTVMTQTKDNATRAKIWREKTPENMAAELDATARLLAQIHRAWNIPLVYSDGDHPGVTTHWSVSQHHPESEGHQDCWPLHEGGYYPVLEVIGLARRHAIGGKP